jgi:hypothetical protein
MNSTTTPPLAALAPRPVRNVRDASVTSTSLRVRARVRETRVVAA